jgi:hypothetical protein
VHALIQLYLFCVVLLSYQNTADCKYTFTALLMGEPGLAERIGNSISSSSVCNTFAGFCLEFRETTGKPITASGTE